MPTYLYECEKHKEFEINHSIKDLIVDCPKCLEEGLEPKKVKRLISKGTSFILTGSGWANEGYK